MWEGVARVLKHTSNTALTYGGTHHILRQYTHTRMLHSWPSNLPAICEMRLHLLQTAQKRLCGHFPQVVCGWELHTYATYTPKNTVHNRQFGFLLLSASEQAHGSLHKLGKIIVLLPTLQKIDIIVVDWASWGLCTLVHTCMYMYMYIYKYTGSAIKSGLLA